MKNNRLPKPVTLAILTLLTTLLWVSLSIYRTLTVKPPSTIEEDIMRTLNPSLNTNTIQDIESAIFFQDSEIPEISVTTKNVLTSNIPATPIPISTTEPMASDSGEVATEE